MKTVVRRDDILRGMMVFRLFGFDVGRNLAVSNLFEASGLRYKNTSIVGRTPPELLPPWEMWQCPATGDWHIWQGSP